MKIELNNKSNLRCIAHGVFDSEKLHINFAFVSLRNGLQSSSRWHVAQPKNTTVGRMELSSGESCGYLPSTKSTPYCLFKLMACNQSFAHRCLSGCLLFFCFRNSIKHKLPVSASGSGRSLSWIRWTHSEHCRRFAGAVLSLLFVWTKH